jgi:hypothetical protein
MTATYTFDVFSSLPASRVGPLGGPNATLVSGDAVDVVARLKAKSDVPLRSHGSLAMNRALMAAGLVDGDGHIQELIYRPTLH